MFNCAVQNQESNEGAKKEDEIRDVKNKLICYSAKFNNFGSTRIQNLYPLLNTSLHALNRGFRTFINHACLIGQNWRNNKMRSRILDVHLVLFFHKKIQRPDEFSTMLNMKLGRLFDLLPTMISLPEDAPKELPVVLLKSKDNEYSCNISRINIDFMFTPKKTYEDFSEIEFFFNEKALSLLKFIEEYNEVNINRIGFVLNYFMLNENPTSKIAHVYIKRDIGETNELSIRFNKKIKEDNLFVNNITSISSMEVDFDGKKQKGILIQRDINNQVSNHKLKFEFLRDFIQQRYNDFSKKELDKVVI